MPSPFHQRVLVLLLALVAGLIWSLAAGPLEAVDAAPGISLFSARVGFVGGVAVLLLAGLPALGLAWLAGAMTRSLRSAAFVLGTALAFPAGHGGSMDGWFWRASLPGSYILLMLEIILLFAGIVVATMLIARTASGRDRLSAGRAPAGAQAAGVAICVVVAALLASVLIQSREVSQVLVGLGLAFAVGAGVAQSVVPAARTLPLLLAPLVLGLVAYIYSLVSFPDHDGLLAAVYTSAIWGPALALPIHYASAGLAGCALGLGIARAAQASAITAGHDAADAPAGQAETR
ncbi:MAG: hypothetical protein WD009_03210 [Phycisphaeraceae bacterium]